MKQLFLNELHKNVVQLNQEESLEYAAGIKSSLNFMVSMGQLILFKFKVHRL